MCRPLVHWFLKTLALLMLISVVANPCPPASMESDGSDGRLLASSLTAGSEAMRQPVKHSDHGRSLPHCRGDAVDTLSPIDFTSGKQKTAFSVEVAALATGQAPKLTLRPPIA